MSDVFFLACLMTGLVGFLFLFARLVQFRYWLRGQSGPTVLAVEGGLSFGLWMFLFIGSVVLDRLFGIGDTKELIINSFALAVAVLPWFGFLRIEMYLRQRREVDDGNGTGHRG
jgi:hypothetical protein